MVKANALVVVPYSRASSVNLVLPKNLDRTRWIAIGKALAELDTVATKSLGWWVGEWWRGGESRIDYGTAEDKAAEAGLNLVTCQHAATVASAIEFCRRRQNLSYSHHVEVAPLEADEQDDLLAQAERDSWSRNDLRAAVRRHQTAKRIGKIATDAESLAELGQYQVLYADPPWQYEDAEPSRAIENNYWPAELDTIKALAVPAADDAVLLCWATSPKLEEAVQVINAWGFGYRTCMVWVKGELEHPTMGMGYYARQAHELLLIAKRGALPVPAPENRPISVIVAPRGAHSEKPAEVYEIIEAMYPGFSKVELFARQSREGWYGWGDQA